MIDKAPYKGLRPYEESDESNFFGREGETRILIDKVLTRKLTLLFSASGIGKSSLLQAALQPSLKRPAPPAHDALDVVYCNDWVRDPGTTLKTKVADTLKDQGKLPKDYPLTRTAPLADFLRRCTLFSSDPLVLILDQFEEFFNYQRHQPEFRPFVRELSAAIRDNAATCFLISMREDFAMELNAFKAELPTLLFDNYYRLEALSCTKAREVIDKPLQRVGYTCEPALLDALLERLGQCNKEQAEGEQTGSGLLDIPPSRIEPPQIQMICTQLWEKEQAAGSRRLTLATYRAMGETDGLLTRYFDAKMSPLSPKDKGLASRAFDFLVSSQGTKMAYPLFELVNRTGIRHPKALAAVLDKLEQARVLRRQTRLLSKDGKSWWEPYYELYHDLFATPINHWNRDYKNRRRRLGAALGATGLVAGGVLLYLGYTVIVQLTNHHLRLNPPIGLSDRIELWSGTRHGLDLLGYRAYRQETRFDRDGVAPDKQFQHIAVGEYQDLNIELIGQMSLFQRIDAYRLAGFDAQALYLADKALMGSDRELSGKVAGGLVRFRSGRVLQVAKRFLKDEPDPTRRQQLVQAWKLLPVTHALPLLTLASKDDASRVRKEVVESLGGLAGQPGGEQALAPLVASLKDTVQTFADQIVRLHTVEALGRFAGQPGGEQALVSLVALLKHPSGDVRSRAVEAVGRFAGQPGGEQALALLVALLKDPASYVRGCAADVLGHFTGQSGGEQALAPLVASLKDTDQTVRRHAVEALGRFAGQPGGEQALAPLVASLKDTDQTVRRHAVEALGRFAGQPGGEQALAPLVASLKDTDQTVRRHTVEALGRFAGQPGGEQVLAPLVASLKDTDQTVRRHTVEALGRFAGQLGGEQALAPLVASLKDTDQTVRRHAVEALGRFAGQPGGEQALAPLVASLKDTDQTVRRHAVEALGRFAGQPGGEQVLAPLVASLKDTDQTVRRHAVEALGRFAGQPGGEQALTPLVASLKDTDQTVRRHAVEALGRFAGQPGGEQALAPLVASLKDTDQTVRRHAVEALGRFAGQPGGEQALAPLMALLKDPDWHVRYDAVGALSRFAGQPGGEQVLAPLMGMLKDLEKSVRGLLAGALSRFADQPGGEQALVTLVALLKDPESYVCVRAAAALGGFVGQPGAEQAVVLLVALLKDSNSDVQEMAVRVLPRFAGLVEMQVASVYLEHLRSLKGEQGYTATLSLGLMNPSRTDLVTPDASKSHPTPTPNRSEYVQTGQTAHNANLLLEGLDTLDKRTQIGVLPALGRFPSPLILSKLLELEQQDDTKMRVAALLALGKNRSPDAVSRLQTVVRDKQESWPIRVQAIRSLGYSGSESAVEFLTKLAEQEPSLINAIYTALDRLASPSALPFLEDGLKQQEQRHQRWREFRSTWREEFNDEKRVDEDKKLKAVKEYWVKELKALQPNSALETWFARQIARLDHERAAELLRHDLYAVRQGAWFGFAQTGDAERVRWLIEQHAEEDNPLFRFALYRAIDRLLQRLEVVGGAEDIKTLDSLYQHWFDELEKDKTPKSEWSTKRRVQQTILERIDWTLPVLNSRVGS